MSSNDAFSATSTPAIPINNPDSSATMDRRGSVGNAVFSNLFRSNSMSTQATQATAAMADAHRRRLSSANVGLHQSAAAVSPTPGPMPASYTFSPGLRRSSTMSSLDENAIEDDEAASPLTGRSPPVSAFSSRRTSFARPRTVTEQQASQYFTWSDQLRSRAEGRSSSFMSGSPPRLPAFSPVTPSGSFSTRRRESSFSGASDAAVMPPSQVPVLPTPTPRPRQKKPDAFQERILKGDFYMD